MAGEVGGERGKEIYRGKGRGRDVAGSIPGHVVCDGRR